MNQLTAHKEQYTRNEADLYLAFELGKKEWKLGFSVGFGQKPRERAIVGGTKKGALKVAWGCSCPHSRQIVVRKDNEVKKKTIRSATLGCGFLFTRSGWGLWW